MSRSGPDDGLRALLRRHVPPPVHWQSVETGQLTGRGVPDTNVCLAEDADVWIECKAARHYECPLRPEQVGWILRRVRTGGRVFVATRRRDRGAARRYDELWIHWGSWARELVDDGLLAAPAALICSGDGGPGTWDWDAVRAALLRRW